jgi:hypothetical protein
VTPPKSTRQLRSAYEYLMGRMASNPRRGKERREFAGGQLSSRAGRTPADGSECAPDEGDRTHRGEGGGYGPLTAVTSDEPLDDLANDRARPDRCGTTSPVVTTKPRRRIRHTAAAEEQAGWRHTRAGPSRTRRSNIGFQADSLSRAFAPTGHSGVFMPESLLIRQGANGCGKATFWMRSAPHRETAVNGHASPTPLPKSRVHLPITPDR